MYYTLYIIHYTLSIIYYTLSIIIYYILYIIYYILYIIYYTLYITYYILYIIHYILYIIHYNIYIYMYIYSSIHWEDLFKSPSLPYCGIIHVVQKTWLDDPNSSVDDAYVPNVSWPSPGDFQSSINDLREWSSDVHGGVHSHRATPIAGWFLGNKHNMFEWMMTGGILRKLHSEAFNHWLVVWTPLKNILNPSEKYVNWDDYYGNQTTNQINSWSAQSIWKCWGPDHWRKLLRRRATEKYCDLLPRQDHGFSPWF